jgi:hypothetical protein
MAVRAQTKHSALDGWGEQVLHLSRASGLALQQAIFSMADFQNECHKVFRRNWETNEVFSIVYFTAAVAEIRHHAQQLDAV